MVEAYVEPNRRAAKDRFAATRAGAVLRYALRSGVLLKGTGTRWHLADVTNDALGLLGAGRLVTIDARDYWPWPTGRVADPRCYVITAVVPGLEGAPSAPVCATAP